MRAKKLFWYLVCSIALCLVHEMSIQSAYSMEVLTNIDIGATARNEGFPSISYNSVDKEFMVLWHTSGKLRDCNNPFDQECSASWHSIDGQRISPEGELLDDPIQLSQPEVCGWKDLPKSAYNPSLK